MLTVTALASQLAIPPIAESRLRGHLESFGSVTSVKVSSAPAAMLLLGKVDRLAVRMSAATLTADAVDPDTLARARGVKDLDARIDELRVGPLRVDSVVVEKHGSALDASASLDVDQLESALPGAHLTTDDGAIVLELADVPLPLPGPIRIQLAVEDGSVVARPLGALSSFLPTQELLDRPDLSVDSLRGTVTAGRVDLNATATLTKL
jgi:hypothetical protein